MEKPLSTTISAIEATWAPKSKYAVRALLNGAVVVVGDSLANSWHPAGEVPGFDEETELDGTAGFEITDPSEIPSAVRSAKWFFGAQAVQFAVIVGDGVGDSYMPEDGGILIRNAKVVAVFEA